MVEEALVALSQPGANFTQACDPGLGASGLRSFGASGLRGTGRRGPNGRGGQNQWRCQNRFGIPFWLVGEFTHFRAYFSWEWDVLFGYDLDFDPWPNGCDF